MKLTAYRVPGVPLELVPAPTNRQWLKEIPGIGRCLPLTIANGAGWWLLNPKKFTAARYSKYNHEVTVSPYDTRHAMSHFGYGTLTIFIPYVFRTPPGWELLFRGPSNYFKEGITPFEGIVETDWHNSTATMNWMLDKDAEVTFEEGEPLCQIVPIRLSELEAMEPEIRDMPDDLDAEFKEWAQKREEQINKNVATGKPTYTMAYARSEKTRRKKVKLRDA